jgi:hypothetical protein
VPDQPRTVNTPVLPRLSNRCNRNEIGRFSRDEAVAIAGILAHVVERAHARQKDAAGRKNGSRKRNWSD